MVRLTQLPLSCSWNHFSLRVIRDVLLYKYFMSRFNILLYFSVEKPSTLVLSKTNYHDLRQSSFISNVEREVVLIVQVFLKKLSAQSGKLYLRLKNIWETYDPHDKWGKWKKLQIRFFTSSVNGMRMLIMTSLGSTIVFLYPLKKFSSSLTFLVFPLTEKEKRMEKEKRKRKEKVKYQLKVNCVNNIVLVYL